MKAQVRLRHGRLTPSACRPDSRPKVVPFPAILLVALAAGSSAAARIEGTEPGDCTDGADNDAEGLLDCDDSTWAGAPRCVREEDGAVGLVSADQTTFFASLRPDATPSIASSSASVHCGNVGVAAHRVVVHVRVEP